MRIVAVGLVLCTAVACSSGGSGQDSGPQGGDFVAVARHDALITRKAIPALVKETFAASSYADTVRVSSDAQRLHDALDGYRQTLLGGPGSYKDEQLAFIEAENELKNACGAIVAWTGDRNAASEASWQDQMTQGIHDWNTASRALWHMAAAGPPPTISL